MAETTEKQYADRDHMAQGNYYMRHLMAMTAEGLHSKSDIAAELAHRDMVIDELRQEVDSLNAKICAVTHYANALRDSQAHQ